MDRVTIQKINVKEKDVKEKEEKEKTDYSKLYDYEFLIEYLTKEEGLVVERDIVCQRFFDIPYFNPKTLTNGELKEAISTVMQLISNDLVEKTRTYMWYICSPYSTEEALENRQAMLPYSETCCANGRYELWAELPYEFQKPIEYGKHLVILSFKIKKETVMESMLDAGIYPAFVRNKIDITSKKKLESLDESSKGFERMLLRHMNGGKYDMTPTIIRIFNEFLSKK
jgi:hypothetical protein